MDWLYPVVPAEKAFYLRTETQSSLRNITLNKNITMETAQKVNNWRFKSGYEFSVIKNKYFAIVSLQDLHQQDANVTDNKD